VFQIFLTDEAKAQLNKLKTDKGFQKRYKAVKKAIRLLASNPSQDQITVIAIPKLKGD
jgi:hypothetical protein